MSNLKSFFYYICILLSITACVEEIDLISEVTFEEILVVEGTITDKLVTQHIKLGRSYALESEGSAFESGATVRIIDNNGTTYNFNETEPGVYASVQPFAASGGLTYKLEIETANGRTYASEEVSRVGESQIDQVYIEVGVNENNEEGITILVDAQNVDPDARFFRYGYEETYKIVAPTYSPFELIIQNDDFPYPPEVLAGLSPQEVVDFFVTKELRPEQEQVCFNTVLSNSILLVDAYDFEGNAIEQNKVRFLNRNNYIISHRYSILVKQYTQSKEAHNFYSSLASLSVEESILSNNQPGFLNGNMRSLINAEEKVAGFFEVSGYDEKRFYFNYEDVYPGAILPPYVKDCSVPWVPALYVADPIELIIGHSPLQRFIEDGYQHFMNNFDTPFVEDYNTALFPYTLVFPECGDCTFLGETEVPDFWID